MSDVELTQFTVSAEVLGVVHDALNDCGHPVAQAIVAVGGIIVDDCCAGLLAVSPERVFRATDPFPQEVFEDQVVDNSYAGITLVVRIYRCIPVLDDRGNPPPIDEQEAGFRAVLEDAAIVWNAVASDDLLGNGWVRSSIVQTFTEPLGGCIGSETRVTVGVPYSRWCPPCIEG